MIRSTLFNLAFYAFSIAVAPVAWGVAKVSTAERVWRVLGFWSRGTVWLVRVILRSRIEMRGLEHIDRSRAQLFVAKHQSELDAILVPALLPGISAVVMAELSRTPFFGAILARIDMVPVAIGGGRQQRTDAIVAGGRRMAAEGRSMLIYPEGELMMLGAKERYRGGAGHLYRAMGVEAVPVAASLGVIWPQRRWRKTAHVTGAIEFMEPIPPGLDFESFMAEVERRIEARTMELIEEHAPAPRLAEARDRAARGATNETAAEDAPRDGPAASGP